ncbi:MAG: hypothetical protein ACFFDT_13305 [Candidatus Hodarchaeota archaeon]
MEKVKNHYLLELSEAFKNADQQNSIKEKSSIPTPFKIYDVSGERYKEKTNVLFKHERLLIYIPFIDEKTEGKDVFVT